jgi:integrase
MKTSVWLAVDINARSSRRAGAAYSTVDARITNWPSGAMPARWARRIPLSDDLVAFLRHHHKLAPAEGKAGSFVFSSRSGGPLSHRNVQRRAFEPAAALAEIDGVSCHSLRHAFASRMISRGISATVLARLTGHESSVRTRRYIHLFDAQRTDDAVRIAMAQ